MSHPCQPSSLQFPLSWALLAAVSHVSPAAFSSLCLGLSLPLCPMSAQQPSVLSVLGSLCRCVPCQPSSLQFPQSWALLAAVSHVRPAAFSSLCLWLSLPLCPMSAQQSSVTSVLGSPCRCVPCQPSSLQFPLPWALLAAVSHVSPAAFSSLCFGLSLPLCPMSAQQPSVPSVLGSPCRCVPCQPSSLQFPLSWALLAAVSHVRPAAFSSLCIGHSLPLCPMSAQQPSVLSVLGFPCRCVPCQPSSLQFPLSWALLAAVSHVSPAAFSSLCLGVSLPLCPMSAQQPSVPSVLASPCRCVPCQPSSLQFSLSWPLLATMSHISPEAFSSLCLGLPSVLPSLVSMLFFIFPFSSSLLGCKSRLFSQACDWSLWRHGQVISTFSFSGRYRWSLCWPQQNLIWHWCCWLHLVTTRSRRSSRVTYVFHR